MNGVLDDGPDADDPEGPDADEPDTEKERREGGDPPEWTEKHWLRSGWGRKLFAADIVATVVLGIVLGIIAVADGNGSDGLSFEITLWTIAGFALMGGFGYLYTPFFKDINRPAGDMVKYNFRLIGTIPLAFAVAVLSEPVFQIENIGTLALAFIAGFSVNAFYTAISDIADRVFPSEDNEVETPENRNDLQ